MKSKYKFNKEYVDKLSHVADVLSAYHRYSTDNLKSIPKGPCLLVTNHSFATYDILLLANAIYKTHSRLSRGLLDKWFFKFQLSKEFFEALGTVEGNPKAAADMLRNSEIVTVAPGGMREAVRPAAQRYSIDWKNRYGFVRTAIETQSPIVLAACPKADDIFDVMTNPITNLILEKFHLPFVFPKGVGFTTIPKPVRLHHKLSDPIIPPAVDKNDQLAVQEFHAKLEKEMKALMKDALRV